jgi:hypothetical protein
VIPDSVDVKKEYNIYRLLRQGATAEPQNVGVPKEVIEANNRWRKHSWAKASVLALIRFSGSM